MARYDVTVRVRTGWPVSASGLHETRRVGRSMPGKCRLRGILVFVEGYTELTLRMRGVPPEMAIQQARMCVPMFGVRRDAVRRIDVRRAHPLRRHRDLLASWVPAAAPRHAFDPGGNRRSAA